MRIAIAALIALIPAAAAADDGFSLSVDFRLIASDARTSYLDGGLGKLRYDEDNDGLQAGRLRAAWDRPLGDSFALHLDASLWNADDNNAFDLTEAWIEFRPVPEGAWRSRLKAGAFYAPISLEHRAAGWTNPYLISSSAINTWVGEELRTVGAEYSLEWLGTREGRSFDAGITAAAYAWNDPTGVVLASRGWSLHDRQTGLFSRIGESGNGFVPGRVIFEEIDDRVGYYVGAHVRWFDRAELRYLHYDNRGDPAVYEAAINDFAWLTRFDSAGLRVDTADDWSFVVQWMGGDTSAGPGSAESWDFDSSFVLASKAFGRHRISARADWFETEHVASMWPPPRLEESGNAWTIGYSFELEPHWHFAVEALEIDSDVSQRAYLGEPADATERQYQLQVIYTR